MNIIDIFQAGGFIMYPLIIFSLIIWTVLIERILFLKSFSSMYTKLNTEATNLIKNNQKDQFKNAINNISDSTSLPYHTLSQHQETPFPDIEQRMDRKLHEVYMMLKKHTWILASIASSAPFVGLFGTVLGIIRSFNNIGKTGKGGFSVVAAGLSEALIATATGIIVAVIAVLFYNYLTNKINNINSDFRSKFSDIAAFYK